MPLSLLEAHKQTAASRAVNKVLRSHLYSCLTSNSLPAGTEVWIFYNTSKQNERTSWVKGTVIEANPHFVECSRHRKGQPMKVAYEDLRLVPRGKLAEEPQSCIHEDIFDNESVQPTRDSQPTLLSESSHERSTPRLVQQQKADFDDDRLNHLLGINKNLKVQELPPLQVNLLAQTSAMDIGLQNVTGPNTPTPNLNSAEQSELVKLSTLIGKNTVSRSKLESAPHWLIDRAVKCEVEDAWNGAFIEVSDRSVPKNANIISSHIIYKVKTDENGVKNSKPDSVHMAIEIKEREPFAAIHQTFNLTPYVSY